MKNKKYLIILIIIVALALCGGIYFFYFSHSKTNPKENISNPTTNEKKEEKAIVDVPVVIDVSNSDNAKIYIDGDLVGEGKAEVKVKEGVHSLRVVDENKGEYTEPFFLSKDVGTFRKTVAVQPKGRAITFITNIDNCTIYIDGTKVITFNGSIELMIPLGKHTIEITREGYESFKKELDITENFTTSLNISLKKKN